MGCGHHDFRTAVGVRMQHARVQLGVVLDQPVQGEQRLAQPTRDRLAVKL